MVISFLLLLLGSLCSEIGIGLAWLGLTWVIDLRALLSPVSASLCGVIDAAVGGLDAVGLSMDEALTDVAAQHRWGVWDTGDA